MRMKRAALVATTYAVVAALAIPRTSASPYMNPHWSSVSLAPRRHPLPSMKSPSPLALMNGVFSSPIHFNSLLHQFGTDFTRTSTTTDHPKSQIIVTDEGFVLEVELPGVRKEDITVKIEDGRRSLHIAGDRKYAIGDKRIAISFDQRFSLDDKVADTSKIEANLIHGLLVVKIPKRHNVDEDNVRIISITEKEAVSSDESELTEDEDGKDAINNGESASMVSSHDDRGPID